MGRTGDYWGNVCRRSYKRRGQTKRPAVKRERCGGARVASEEESAQQKIDEGVPCKRAKVRRGRNGATEAMRVALFPMLNLRRPGIVAFVLVVSVAFLIGRPARAQQQQAPVVSSSPTEGRTVDPFVAPSVADLFSKLEAFSPLPAEQSRRAVRHTFWTNRVRLALNFGALVGDGFLIVQARDKSRVPALGQELLRRARALGIGSALVARSQSLIELGERGQWDKLKTELAAAQADVEAALLALRDADLVLFVNLGGWLRGVEGAGAATAERYTPERAAAMARPIVVRYFLDRLDKVNPALREPLVLTIIKQLRAMDAILDKPGGQAISEPEARRLHKLTTELNAVIAAPDDA